MMPIELLERITELTNSALIERRWLAALHDIEQTWNKADSGVNEAVKERYRVKAVAARSRADRYEQQLCDALTELRAHNATHK